MKRSLKPSFHLKVSSCTKGSKGCSGGKRGEIDTLTLSGANEMRGNQKTKRKVQKKKEKKLTNVSFMYVCVAGNGEMLVFFFVFSPNNSLIDNSLSE